MVPYHIPPPLLTGFFFCLLQKFLRKRILALVHLRSTRYLIIVIVIEEIVERKKFLLIDIQITEDNCYDHILGGIKNGRQ